MKHVILLGCIHLHNSCELLNRYVQLQGSSIIHVLSYQLCLVKKMHGPNHLNTHTHTYIYIYYLDWVLFQMIQRLRSHEIDGHIPDIAWGLWNDLNNYFVLSFVVSDNINFIPPVWHGQKYLSTAGIIVYHGTCLKKQRFCTWKNIFNMKKNRHYQLSGTLWQSLMQRESAAIPCHVSGIFKIVPHCLLMRWKMN